jgi:hypothetical protein
VGVIVVDQHNEQAKTTVAAVEYLGIFLLPNAHAARA